MPISHDESPVDPRDLAANELSELLADEACQISAEQAAELARLIASAGSIENAIAALASLAQQTRAA